MNGWIGRILQRNGYRLERDYRFPRSDLNLLKMAALALPRPSEGCLELVQIGAFDGVTSDPVCGLLETKRFRAIIVEPQARPFEELKRRYTGREEIILEQALVSSSDGMADLYMPSKVECSQLACMDREHLLRLGFSDFEISSVSVKTMSPKTLIVKHRIERLDVLQIDAEGADFRILELFLAAGIRPSIINMETFHLSATDRPALRQRMSALGYQFVDYSLDTLFVNPRSFDHA